MDHAVSIGKSLYRTPREDVLIDDQLVGIPRQGSLELQFLNSGLTLADWSISDGIDSTVALMSPCEEGMGVAGVAGRALVLRIEPTSASRPFGFDHSLLSSADAFAPADLPALRAALAPGQACPWHAVPPLFR